MADRARKSLVGDPRAYASSYDYFDINDNSELSNLKGYDPANVNMLTNINCPTGVDGHTYATRPFPTSGCALIDYQTNDYGSSEQQDNSAKKNNDYSFLTTDPQNCNKKKWNLDKEFRHGSDGRVLGVRDIQSDIDVPTKSQYKFQLMDYVRNASSPSETDCNKDGTKWESMKCWFNRPGNIYDMEEYMGSVWNNAFRDTTYLPTRAKSYDGPNVCNNDSFQLAGDYQGQTVSDDKPKSIDRVKNNSISYTSNHCCPKIIGSDDCPKYTKKEQSVDLFTPKEEFSGFYDYPNKQDTTECYNYPYNTHPEFYPEDIARQIAAQQQGGITSIQYNPYINRIRSGGIQCGPRSSPNSEDEIKFGTGLKINKTVLRKGQYTEEIDVMKNHGNYYGTRFKLDNRYDYNWRNDSGATGYEHYLDPEDYVPLSNQGQTSQILNEGGSLNQDTQINNTTTINDIIPRQLGHPDRIKPMCDNIICNDIEKTQYIQTIYDAFCSKIENHSNSASPKFATKFQKFYRPVGISKDGIDPSLSPQDKAMYPDICCEPIDFSNKWSFVGCDAEGKNPYFIDHIYNDASPTYPEPVYGQRKKIPPQMKLRNINQCIQSQEVKCVTNMSYNQDLNLTNFYEYQLKNKQCNNMINNKIRNETMIGNHYDRPLEELCSSTHGCIHGFHNEYKGTIFKNMYWLQDSNASPRQNAGYVPSKGYFADSNWVDTPARLLPLDDPNGYITNSDWRFNLQNPTSPVPTHNTPYTKCNPIPSSTNISDIEIYDKRIDWDKDEKKLRFIPRNQESPPPHDKLFKIYCKTSNWEPGSTPDDGYFNNYGRSEGDPSINHSPPPPCTAPPCPHYYDINCPEERVEEGGEVYF